MEKPIGNEGSFHFNWFITIEIESIYFLALNRGFQLWIAIVLDWETIFHGLPFPNDLSLKLRYQIQICVSKRFQSIISCHDSSIYKDLLEYFRPSQSIFAGGESDPQFCVFSVSLWVRLYELWSTGKLLQIHCSEILFSSALECGLLLTFRGSVQSHFIFFE